MTSQFSQNTHPSDTELAIAARRGDKRAFVQIVERHQPLVRGITFSLLRDFGAAEDAAQEAFLAAWRGIAQLEEPGSLKAWLAQIARNAAAKVSRKLGRDVAREDLNSAESADPSPGPDELAASQEEVTLVLQAISQMPENFRLPLILFYRELQSARQVAEALDLNEDVVRQRLARGREMLRERLVGVIERVLPRSKPAHVFTLAVSAAIGALPTPSAVAATAFSAASTAKTTLAAAAAVTLACLPLGYLAARSMEPQGSPPVSPVGASVLPVGSSTTHFPDGALLAEWRKLHEIHGSTAEAMPGLCMAILKMEDNRKRHLFCSALMAEWVELAPEAGFAFFCQNRLGSDLPGKYFREWLARSPDAAVSALTTCGIDWHEIASKALTEIAKLAPGRLAEVAMVLPKFPTAPSRDVRDAFAAAAALDLAVSRKLAESMGGEQRVEALSGVAQAWARTDATAAIAWAKGLSDVADQEEVIRCAITGLASINPIQALGLINSIPAGGRAGYPDEKTGPRVVAEAANCDRTLGRDRAHECPPVFAPRGFPRKVQTRQIVHGGLVQEGWGQRGRTHLGSSTNPGHGGFATPSGGAASGN